MGQARRDGGGMKDGAAQRYDIFNGKWGISGRPDITAQWVQRGTPWHKTSHLIYRYVRIKRRKFGRVGIELGWTFLALNFMPRRSPLHL